MSLPTAASLFSFYRRNLPLSITSVLCCLTTLAVVPLREPGEPVLHVHHDHATALDHRVSARACAPVHPGLAFAILPSPPPRHSRHGPERRTPCVRLVQPPSVVPDLAMPPSRLGAEPVSLPALPCCKRCAFTPHAHPCRPRHAKTVPSSSLCPVATAAPPPRRRACIVPRPMGPLVEHSRRFAPSAGLEHTHGHTALQPHQI